MLLKKDTDDSLFFKKSIFRLAKLIFTYPNRMFHIRKLSKESGLSTTSVLRATDELNRLKIIRLIKTDITTNICADLESESYRFYKRIFNIYLLEICDVIGKIKETYNPKTIVLFGSFSKGEDIEESDIDILIITNQKDRRALSLDTFEKILNRRINLHILKSFEKSGSEFRNAVANGIVLYGYMKVV